MQNLEEVTMLEVRVDVTMICIDPLAEASAACIPTLPLHQTLRRRPFKVALVLGMGASCGVMSQHERGTH